MSRPTALITGPTSGIGYAFARRLAARGHDLVLVSRDVARLDTVAADLRARHGVEVEVLPADLSQREQTERVAERLRTGRPVDVLVNNAGFGLAQPFVGGDLALEEAALDVMVRSVLVLTHAAVPGMVERGHGVVITVSSVASFLSMGTYSAAKAWATTFTASLAAELSGSGVTATALCPGFVRTELHQRMGVDPSRVAPSFAWLDVEDLVRECLDDVAAGRAVSVPSGRYAAGVAVLRHLPLRGHELIGRRFTSNYRARRRPVAAGSGRSSGQP